MPTPGSVSKRRKMALVVPSASSRPSKGNLRTAARIGRRRALRVRRTTGPVGACSRCLPACRVTLASGADSGAPSPAEDAVRRLARVDVHGARSVQVFLRAEAPGGFDAAAREEGWLAVVGHAGEREEHPRGVASVGPPLRGVVVVRGGKARPRLQRRRDATRRQSSVATV